MPKAWLVRAPGQSFTVSTEWLTSTLSTMESAPKLRFSLEKDLLARLTILRREAEAFESVGAERDDAAARARLAEILKRREFASVSQPGWFQSLAGRIGSWIARMLRRILRPLAGFSHSSQILVWSLAAILFVVLAFLVVRIFMRTARTAELAIESPAPTGKTWRDWAREALEAAARRDFRDAIHRGYWAGVYRLQDMGVLKMERDRTPREYLRILAGSPPEESGRTTSGAASGADHSQRREALAELTRRLEVTWYGCQGATDNDFRATIENLEALGCRFPSILPTAES
ncbi:MAG TPA: hypothetical protein VEU31_03420 [Candidatus Acidoferrales bacterium]|nr:hypothetical protein [Candidatus Acidoferrales bacterium]